MDNDSLAALLLGFIQFILYAGAMALSFALTLLGLYALHFTYSVPLRRAERARLFLDLVGDALHRGQSVEQMILSLAGSRDTAMGVRFHLLAAYIESGLKLPEALQKVPRFLPPQVTAILQTGNKLGNLPSVLPAAHELLRDRPAGVRSAMHYMMLVILFFSPVAILLITLISVFVIPRFRDVSAGMGIQPWAMARLVFDNTNWLIGFEITISVILTFATVVYIGGPGFVRHFQWRGLPICDWISWHVPWKQKRLQRTFSAMLAVLLDNGVPEAEAVRLAADCTANEICRRRSVKVVRSLEQGITLEQAVRHFDQQGEFHWRLSNAIHSHGGFLHALRGWHETLDAKAFQQEEATAHVVTSGLVIMNGLLVALIAIAMFGVLIVCINGVLWST